MSAKSIERQARLEELKTATEEWADKRIEQLEARVAINKALLKGRTGSERLAQASVKRTSELVVSAISDFLAS